MLVYLILGWMVAHFCRWSMPTKNQSLWAVFLPAGIAWAWAGSTALCLALPGDALGVAAVLGLPACLLASPSLLFVISFLGAVGTAFNLIGPLGNSVSVMGSAIFFAGLLPSLLFWLGSRWGSQKEKETKKEPETA